MPGSGVWRCPRCGPRSATTPSPQQWLPAGFELTHVAVLPGTRANAVRGAGTNPPDTDVVSLAYRRGIQQVTVTTRRDGGPTVRWVDPFGTDPSGAEARDLRSGRFHGTTVDVVEGDAVEIPHVWGRGDGLVFTVAGDVTASELTRITGSLR